MKPVSMWIVLGMSLLLVTGTMAQTSKNPRQNLFGDFGDLDGFLATVTQPKPQNGAPTIPISPMRTSSDASQFIPGVIQVIRQTELPKTSLKPASQSRAILIDIDGDQIVFEEF